MTENEKKLIELLKLQIEAVWGHCYSVYSEPRDEAIKFLKDQYGLIPCEGNPQHRYGVTWKLEENN